VERTPGTSWSTKRGKLYRFDRGGVQVIRAWLDPAAWTKWDRGPWKGYGPWVDLSAASEQHTPFSWSAGVEVEAFRAIPQDILEGVLGAYLDRMQWASLQLAVRVPGALDLMEAVPVLGAALACSRRLKPRPVSRPLRAARSLLRRGPGMVTLRRVAGWLGFKASQCFVDTLRRLVLVPDRPLGIDLLDGLRAAWREPCARKRLLDADLDERLHGSKLFSPDHPPERGTCATMGRSCSAKSRMRKTMYSVEKVRVDLRDQWRVYRDGRWTGKWFTSESNALRKIRELERWQEAAEAEPFDASEEVEEDDWWEEDDDWSEEDDDDGEVDDFEEEEGFAVAVDESYLMRIQRGRQPPSGLKGKIRRIVGAAPFYIGITNRPGRRSNQKPYNGPHFDVMYVLVEGPYWKPIRRREERLVEWAKAEGLNILNTTNPPGKRGRMGPYFLYVVV